MHETQKDVASLTARIFTLSLRISHAAPGAPNSDRWRELYACVMALKPLLGVGDGEADDLDTLVSRITRENRHDAQG